MVFVHIAFGGAAIVLCVGLLLKFVMESRQMDADWPGPRPELDPETKIWPANKI